MANQEIAQIFYQIAEFLEMKESTESAFEARAYAKAARMIETSEEDLREIYQTQGIEGLKQISGVGQGLAEKIEEYLRTGQIKKYQRLKKESPVDLEKLTKVEGLGPRRIKILYQKLGVKNLKDLGKAARAGKISQLEGFGEQSEKNILQGIEFVKSSQGRFLLGRALPLAKEMLRDLAGLPEVSKISLAGSVRRMEETIGDLDILAVSSQPAKVIEYFVKRQEVVKVWAKGTTKSSVRLKQGFDCDLRIVANKSFGSALQYFTGSKDHNIALRRLAIKKGLKLNEYGVFKKGKYLAGQTEAGVYQAIGLPYIQPELRTNSGEIQAGLSQSKGGEYSLPRLVAYGQIKGETQCHTDWSDGANTIEQMVRAAKKIGYQYILITDHAGWLKVANALDEKRIDNYLAEIDRVDRKISGIKVLKGIEVDIKSNGELAIGNQALAKLDLALASVHNRFKMDRADMTKRLKRAIEHPLVKIIGHPTGRLVKGRPGYQFDYQAIFEAAKKHRTALEINANFERLDLKDVDIRQAVEQGVSLTIGTDAHAANQLTMMEFGLGQARRGWAEKKDILNAQPLTKFLEYFKNK